MIRNAAGHSIAGSFPFRYSDEAPEPAEPTADPTVEREPLAGDLRRTFQKVALLSRGVALFYGLFTILNAVAHLRRPGVNVHLWWIDVAVIERRLPAGLFDGLLIAAGALLLVHAVHPKARGLLRWTIFAAVVLLYAVCLGNAVAYYAGLMRGTFRTVVPFPMALLIAAGLEAIGIALAAGRAQTSRLREGLLAVFAFALCTILWPLGLIAFVGPVESLAPADAAVVFGARVYAGGTPSHALGDRVHKAIDLYDSGRVHTLILSGGPGDGPVDEPTAMQTLARGRDVPESALILDPAGVNTRATAANAIPILNAMDADTVLAVSHFYHLPRIRMTFQQYGRDVDPAPAPQRRTLLKLPWFIARESAAIWVYYLHLPLAPAAERPTQQRPHARAGADVGPTLLFAPDPLQYPVPTRTFRCVRP